MNSRKNTKGYPIMRLIPLILIFISMIWFSQAHTQERLESPETLAVKVEKIIIQSDSMLRGLMANFPHPILTTITVIDSAGDFIRNLADTSRWLGPDDVAQIGLPISEIWLPILEYHEENPSIPENPNLYHQIPSPLFIEMVQDMHVPTSTMLVMDISSSMSPKLDDVKEGARLYVDQLRPVDRAGVILFHSEVIKIQQFTKDKDLLIETINSAETDLGTAINDALMAAIQQTKYEESRPRIIVYTDGHDNGSTYTSRAVIDSALVYNIPIYTIALGDYTIKDTLRLIADTTGGFFFKADSANQMLDIYSKLSDLIRHFYVMAHTSPDPVRNNTWRTVDITVNLPKNYGGYQLSGTGKYFIEGVTPESAADLSITLNSITATTIIKSNDTLNAVLPGEVYKYQLKIKNHGPGKANYIKISHIMPDSVEFINTTSQPLFTKDSLIIWQFNDLEVNDEIDILVSVQLPSDISTELHELISLVNLVGDTDYNLENNSDEDTVRVFFSPPSQNYDLSISQLAITDSIAVVENDSIQVVLQGDTVDYILTVENFGPKTARNFSVWNVTPDSVNIVDFSLRPTEYSADTLFWQFDSLVAGDVLSISLYAEIADSLSSNLFPLTNVSGVIADKDTFEQNNIATTTVYAILRSNNQHLEYDLAISQLAITDSIAVVGNDSIQVVLQGENVDYILSIENLGHATAHDFRVWNVLHDSVSIVNFSMRPTGQIADTLFWQFDSLSAGDVLNISLHAKVADSFPSNLFPLTNISGLIADKDTFEQNNIATTTVYAILPPDNQQLGYDLSISQLAMTDSIAVIGNDSIQVVLQGDTVAYILKVENLGPVTAYNFNVWNLLPDSVSIVDYSVQSTKQNADTVFWQFDSLAAGDFLNISLHAQVADSLPNNIFPLTNVSGVIADKDTFEQNNIASTTIYAIAKSYSQPLANVDVSVSQTARTDSFAVVENDTIRFARSGETYSYTITVTNNGLGIAHSVRIINYLPDSVSVKNSQPLPDIIANDSLVWNLGDLAALSSHKLKFDVTVSSNMPIGKHLLINKVFASALNEDPEFLANNTSIDTVHNFVKPAEDLLPIIVANPPIVEVGDEVSVRVQVLFPIESWDILVYLADGNINFDYADAFINNTRLEPDRWYDIDQKYTNTKMFTSAEQEQIIFELRTVDIFGKVRTAQAFVTVMSSNDFYLDRNVFEVYRLEPLGINFKLSSNRIARLDVFDISGKKITNLTEGSYQAGWNAFTWNGMLENGLTIGSGLYFITLKSGNYNVMKKVMIVQ
jgi:VWFA-related protein